MIAFVILHYRAADMTRKCVERIKALEGDKKIVIVDNASPNGAGQELLDEYTEDSEIKVILNPENSGFAKGNNMGVRWVQKNVPAEFVVVLNNDVEILQKDFCPKVEAIYRRHSFDVLGPDIISVFSGIRAESEEPSRIFTGIRKKETGKGSAYKEPDPCCYSAAEKKEKRQPGNLEESTAQKKSKTSLSTAVSPTEGSVLQVDPALRFCQTLSEKASGAILSEDLYVF